MKKIKREEVKRPHLLCDCDCKLEKDIVFTRCPGCDKSFFTPELEGRKIRKKNGKYEPKELFY